MNSRRVFFACAAAFSFLFASCVGASASFTVKRGGSGSVALEYRVAKTFSSMGDFLRESGPPLPLSKEDFAASIKNVEGLELKSYEQKEDGSDDVYTVKIAFKKLEDVVSYLNSSQNQRIIYKEEDGKKTLTYFFWRSLESNDIVKDDAMVSVISQAFNGYDFAFSINLPKAYSVKYINAAGAELKNQPPAVITHNKKTYSLKTPASSVFLADETSGFVISW